MSFLRSQSPVEDSETRYTRNACTHTRARLHTHMHTRSCDETVGGAGELANAKHRIRAEKKRSESMLDELAGPLANASASAFFTPFLSNSLSLDRPLPLSLVLSAFLP